MEEFIDILIENFPKSVHFPTIKQTRSDDFMKMIDILDRFREEEENSRFRPTNTHLIEVIPHTQTEDVLTIDTTPMAANNIINVITPPLAIRNTRTLCNKEITVVSVTKITVTKITNATVIKITTTTTKTTTHIETGVIMITTTTNVMTRTTKRTTK